VALFYKAIQLLFCCSAILSHTAPSPTCLQLDSHISIPAHGKDKQLLLRNVTWNLHTLLSFISQHGHSKQHGNLGNIVSSGAVIFLAPQCVGVCTWVCAHGCVHMGVWGVILPSRKLSYRIVK
jgi:hypothetical protein